MSNLEVSLVLVLLYQFRIVPLDFAELFAVLRTDWNTREENSRLKVIAFNLQ